jgi:outer membrane protein
MKRTILSLLTGVALAALVAAPAFADSTDDSYSQWQIHVRVVGVIPDSSGSTVNLAGTPVPASSLSITNSVVPEVDASYFFTKNWAVEAICCVTPHDISGSGSLAGLKVGRVWAFPPTVLAQYHVTSFGALQPYVGAGVNYTWFFSQKAANQPDPNLLGAEVTGLHVHSTFGFALQAGFDYMIDPHWGLNLDAKKLFLEPNYTAMVSNTVPVSGRANIDPWITGVGVTYRF